MCDDAKSTFEVPAYDAEAIETKWQKTWADTELYKTDEDPAKPKKFVMEMFPYPSGDLHMGHARNYTIGDAMARQARMRGFDVLHPMGFDAFGLPAENAAIKHNTQAGEWTHQNIAQAVKTMKRMGFSYDYDRMFNTCDPEYYKWGQWMFLKMWEKGLAYRSTSPVNWCPSCNTVLANEQVVDGKCWRCGSVPEKRELSQWYLKITDYAQELLDDLDQLDGWPENVKAQQRNWIGRSEGAEIDFALAAEDGVTPTDRKITVFTTRADTLFGVSFFLLPRAPLPPSSSPAPSTRPPLRSSRPRPRRSAPSTARAPSARNTVSSPAVTSSTRSTAARPRSGSPTMSSWTTAPAPSWASPAATSATSTSQRSTASRSPRSSARRTTRSTRSSRTSASCASPPSTGTTPWSPRATSSSPASSPA